MAGLIARVFLFACYIALSTIKRSFKKKGKNKTVWQVLVLFVYCVQKIENRGQVITLTVPTM
jgi:hypothetical protein